MSHNSLPAWAYAAALAALPLQTPQRLRQLINTADPAETWARIVGGQGVVLQYPKMCNTHGSLHPKTAQCSCTRRVSETILM